MEQLPDWIRIVAALGPAGVSVAGLSAALVAWRGHVRQKQADELSRFWERLTWAIDHVASDDVHDANMGLNVLNNLRGSPEVQQRDRDLLDEIVENVYTRVDEDGYDVEES